MEVVTPEIRGRILDILRQYTFRSGLCDCISHLSAAIEIQRVISMSVKSVMLECKIIDSSIPMGKSFMGFSLDSQQCQHDQVRSITVVVSSEQWGHVVSHHKRCALIKAVVHGTILDVRDPISSIVPFRVGSEVINEHVVTAELFAGGFSGWTQVIKKLIMENIPLIHRWVLDKDVCAKHMYERSYDITMTAFDMSSFEKAYQQCVENDLDPYIYFHTELETPWWCCFASKDETDLLCMSPPCPPWSEANLGGGLSRSDGLLMVHLLGILSIIRPRVLLMENVKTMSTHPHFGIIKALFLWAGFSLKWIAPLNLDECIPQHRERLLLIATSDTDSNLEPHVCSKWPMGYHPTLRTYDAVMNLDDYWQSCAELTPEELRLYLNPKYLPKGPNVTANQKRTRFDVAGYCIRSLDQKASCFLTTYGSPLTLDEEMLSRGGLYESLIFQNDQVRKFTPLEVCILLGVVRPVWVPINLREAFKLLGNAISVPHAAIGIANGLMFLIPMIFDCPAQEIFLQITKNHLTASNIQINRSEEGFLISIRHEGCQLCPTVPMRKMGNCVVESPLSMYDVFCEFDLPLRSVLALLNGPSTPQSLNIQVGLTSEFQIPLTQDILMQASKVRIHATVPSLLALDESSFQEDVNAYDFLIILTSAGIVCIRRHGDLTCQGVLHALDVLEFPTPDKAVLTNLMGIQHMNDCKPPTISFLGSCRLKFDHTAFQIDCPVLQEDKHCFRFCCDEGSSMTFLMACRDWGILDDLLSLGWYVSVSFHEMGGFCKVPILQKIPGRLSVSHHDIQEFLIARVFKVFLHQKFPREYPDSINIAIKLWNTWIWSGWVQNHQDLQGIIMAWNEANLVFGRDHPIRLVAGGKGINPEFPVAYFKQEVVFETGILPIHIVGTLHGGGPKHHVDISSVSEEDSVMDGAERHSSPEMLQQFVETALHRAMTIRMEHNIHLGDPLSVECLATLMLREVEGMFVAESTMHHLLEVFQLFRWAAIDQTLDENGWLVLLQFRSYESPIRARMVITPKPNNRQADRAFVRAFLTSTLFFASVPRPIALRDASVSVSLKLFGVTLSRERIPHHWQLRELLSSWSVISRFTGWVPHPRLICNGRGTNPEFCIGDYAQEHHDSVPVAKFHVVFSLHGGGSSKTRQDDIISVKNRLAAFLLDQGCDIQAVSLFADKCLQAAGHVTVSHVLKIDHHDKKLEALQQLAKTLALSFPDVNKAASKRIQQTRTKVTERDIKPISVDVDTFSLKAGFLVNEDGTPCNQLKSIRAGASGVAFVQCEQSVEWIRSDRKFSPDELGVLVVGPCPKGHEECKPVQLPAFNTAGHPLVISACLHQLGEKQVQISDKQSVSLKIDETQVVAITIYKNEIEGIAWSDFVHSPCKFCFQILEASGCQVSMPSPPWGRSWHGIRGKSQPSEAESFQCHVRVSKKDLPGILCASGFRGLYTTPKDDQHVIDKDYCIIWDDRSLPEMQVLASSTVNCMGLIKSLKNGGKKVNRGFRCHRDKLPEVHQAIKPGVDIPDVTRIEWVAKIMPTPQGASFTDVREFLSKMKWPAKPLKALGSTAWLVGSPTKFADNFGSWNGQVLLVQWLPKKMERPQKIILAGQHETSISGARTGILEQDPWAAWIHNKSGTSPNHTVLKTSANGPGSAPFVPRSVDGPNEARFKDHDAKIEELRNQLSTISKKVDSQGDEQKDFQHKLKQDLEQFKTETVGNIQGIHDAFDLSLQKSLANQNQAMQSNFSELKNLILGRPSPAKKAKASPSEHDELM